MHAAQTFLIYASRGDCCTKLETAMGNEKWGREGGIWFKKSAALSQPHQQLNFCF